MGILFFNSKLKYYAQKRGSKMKIKTNLIIPVLFILTSCSSIPEGAKLESRDPETVVRSIQQLKINLIRSNADVLAKSSFEKGDNKLKASLKSIEERKPLKETLEKLSVSKAYFQKAKEVSNSREDVPESVLMARRGATAAEVYSYRPLKEKLKDADDSLIEETNNFSKQLTSENIAYFLSSYQRLEIQSIQNSRLGTLRKVMKDAENRKAKKLAPKTYTKALNDVNVAENLINLSSRDPSQYKESVEVASESVRLLDDVMTMLRGEAKGSTERTALTLVYQKRELENLSDKVGVLQSSLDKSSEKMDTLSKDLATKKATILSTEDRIKFQNMMNQVRNSFTENEASVYQQGSSLIIRLKKINFKSGDATIPTNSMAFLSKVDNVISRLNPEEVMIEGHTDSTGKRANNLMLSNKRANAVKKYLMALDANYTIDFRGYGESKPIADNKTYLGRTLNRRVDIIVRGRPSNEDNRL